jgi:hypothetical protein
LQIFENIDEVDELNAGAKRAITNFYEIFLDLIEASKKKEVSELLDYIV